MPDTFLGSHTFNVSDLTPFSVGLQNSWSNSLQLGEYDGDQAQEDMEANQQDQEEVKAQMRVKELEHDKESLQSDFEAAQESTALLRGMVEKSRGEYLAQVQETIKTEILMGQAITALDCEVMELRGKVTHLGAETSSLHQQNSHLAGELESIKEAAATREKKLEEVVSELSEAKGQLEEAASSIASLTAEMNAVEASKQKLEVEKADLMGVGAEAFADGFELALEQIKCILPDLDLSQFSIYHEVVDGKLVPPS